MRFVNIGLSLLLVVVFFFLFLISISWEILLQPTGVSFLKTLLQLVVDLQYSMGYKVGKNSSVIITSLKIYFRTNGWL